MLAPFAGVITERYADTGEWAVPGSPVLELVDLNSLRLDVPVPQARFGDITDDTAVTVTTPALPQQTLGARVEATVPVSDPTARTLRVRLAVDNPQARLLPGMSAQAAFHLQSEADLVLDKVWSALGSEEAISDELRMEQRRWINRRDACLIDNDPRGCVRKVMLERITELSGL